LRGVEAEIAVSVTEDGLRVEMAEGSDGETFFSFGSARPENALDRVLSVVGASLAALPNPVIIEGHTDAAPYPRADYTNWELSVDRANTARRMLVDRGLDESRVLEVRGYADRRLRYPDEPRNPGNRRVTLFVASVGASPAAELPGTDAGSGGGG
ncbi:MAG: OmpA family protein, partial [Longimicrobiales bacterium]